MKVWLATAGEYSDFCVVKVFAREEDAQAYELADDVEEWEVNEGPILTRNVIRLVWHPARPEGEGNPWVFNDRKDVDDSPGVKHQWVPANPGNETYLVVEGWDAVGVNKVYSEQCAQYIARQDMGTA
jgi:hypothetical protein